MTVTVPSTDRTGAYQLQQQVTTLAALTDPSSQQLLGQRQIDLVNTLMAQGKLSAASILSQISYSSTNPIIAQITALNTLISSYGAGMPASDAAVTLGQLQVQLVQELMASAQMTAASILSNMTYVGGAAN